MPVLQPIENLSGLIVDGKFHLELLVESTDQHCDAYDEWMDSYFDNPSHEKLLQAPYEVMEKLLMENYDVFNWIKEGFAVSKNDLKSFITK